MLPPSFEISRLGGLFTFCIALSTVCDGFGSDVTDSEALLESGPEADGEDPESEACLGGRPLGGLVAMVASSLR